MTRNITVTHDGTTYDATVMTVRSTMLGTEDHGIFTTYLSCEAGSTGVSVGGYGLDAWSEEARDRLGTGAGLQFVKELIATVGASSWEDVRGRQVLVLWEQGNGGLGGTAQGIAHISDEDRVMPFKSWWTAAAERHLHGTDL